MAAEATAAAAAADSDVTAAAAGGGVTGTYQTDYLYSHIPGHEARPAFHGLTLRAASFALEQRQALQHSSGHACTIARPGLSACLSSLVLAEADSEWGAAQRQCTQSEFDSLHHPETFD